MNQNHTANGDTMDTIDENEEKEFSTSTEFTPAVRTEEVKYIQPEERTSEGRIFIYFIMMINSVLAIGHLFWND